MKKVELLKSIVDIYLIFAALICFVLILVAPFNLLEVKLTSDEYDSIKSMPWYAWLEFVFAAIAYVCLFMGILFLRKASRFMNSKSLYKQELQQHVKKAGIAVLGCGIFLWVSSLVSWLYYTIYKSSSSIAISESTMFMFILMVFGLFLLIQSDFMKRAIALKTENDLTI